MSANFSLRKHRLGYLEAHPKPSHQDLVEYYSTKYWGYSDCRNSYANEYGENELLHRKLTFLECVNYLPLNGNCFLDIGVGEGLLLKAFLDFGFEVKGIDITKSGIHADLLEALENRIEVGDLKDLLPILCRENRKYDFVCANQVLHHLPDPNSLLNPVRELLSPNGVFRVQVSNDGSWFQDQIVVSGAADSNYWAAYPDHLSYFTKESLLRTLDEAGFEIIEVMADFPIELFLLNPDSNYKRDRTRGKGCHEARVKFELMLASDFDRFLEFRRVCGQVEIGRDLIVYCKLKS